MIPANLQLTERDIRKKHLRVAPYCRVSTDSKERLNSYNAQIAYYTEKIAATPEWTMVRLYADESTTGTSMKKRKEFLRMLRDCDRGRIDLVITKSVPCFRRNTLDSLPEIAPDESAIVRRIFIQYLLGQSVRQICRDLMTDGVKTAQGSDSWHNSVVRKMLQNEKNIGDTRLHLRTIILIQWVSR